MMNLEEAYPRWARFTALPMLVMIGLDGGKSNNVIAAELPIWRTRKGNLKKWPGPVVSEYGELEVIVSWGSKLAPFRSIRPFKIW